MAMDIFACWAKYLLCTFNMVFFIAGSILLAIGIWIIVDQNSFIAVTKLIEYLEESKLVDMPEVTDNLEQLTKPNVIQQAGYILVAVGAFIFIISFLGYYGSVKESSGLLCCYGVALILIVLAEIAVGSYIYVHKEKAEAKTRKIFKNTIHKYYTTPEKTDAVTLFWNHMMVQLKCCGVDNYQDFKESQFGKQSKRKVPDACCMLTKSKNSTGYDLKDPNCPSKPSQKNSYFNKGCYEAFMKLLMAHWDYVVAILIGLVVAQIVAIFLAFCLCKSIHRYIR